MTGEDIHHFRYYYFLGIGGIGMSALARFFARAGKTVAGYDRTATPLTQELAAEGMTITYADALDALPAWVTDFPTETLVVWTPAVPRDHPQLVFFQQNQYALMKRAAVLGAISRAYTTLAVAGTHGKTTTTTMLAHLLQHQGTNLTAFMGGISANYNTNLLLSPTPGPDMRVVAEADEFDRSFLHLSPALAIITSADADHLDIYGEAESLRHTFELFAQRVTPGGALLLRAGLPLELPALDNVTVYTYGQPGTHAWGENPRFENGRYCFTLVLGGQRAEATLAMPGQHNMENACAAALAASLYGLTLEEIVRGLAAFRGVRRRFEYIVDTPQHIYIDDYAHHPTEIRACLSAVKQLYPDRQLVACFQPHLFSRTRDFLHDFAEALSLADQLVLLDIYPARELPLPGITSAVLLDLVPITKKRLLSKYDFVQYVSAQKPALLVTIGAGDIDTVVPELRTVLTTA